MKSLVRNAEVHIPKKNTIVYSKGETVHQMSLVLTGQLAIQESNAEQSENSKTEMEKDQVFDILFDVSKIHNKEQKKRMSLISLSVSRKMK